MALNPTFASNPRSIDVVSISTANTNRDGTGTITTLATGTSAGTKIMEVVAQATVSTTAGMIRLFITTDSGTTWQLYDELPVGAVTVSATVPAYRISRLYPNLVLTGTSNRLGVSTHNAENFRVFALGADL